MEQVENISERTFPARPHSIEDTGLSSHFLADLALRIIHVQGLALASQVAEALRLPLANIVDKALESLQRDGWIAVTSPAGVSPASIRYALTNDGLLRARELLDQCQYTGPAPVSLAAYSKMVKAQSMAGEGVSPSEVERGLAHLVLPKETLDQIGPAIDAGKSLFLYGHTGNGKTSIGLAIGAMMTGAIWVPYAVTAEGQIVKVIDSLVHRTVGEPAESAEPPPVRKGLLSRLVIEKPGEARWTRDGDIVDQRWVPIQRPLVIGGGELTLKNLDLVFDPTTKYYEAPHQMKANGGVFLLDDLGRQKTSAREILNRWILPLEKRVDFLTPVLGNRFEIPFDALLVFATNLNLTEVADETFLRRLRHKIHATDPTWEAFAEIFRREAVARKIAYSSDGLRYIVAEHYLKVKREPRGVHPRDLLDELVDIAHYRDVPPRMSKELLDLACRAYFLEDGAGAPAS